MPETNAHTEAPGGPKEPFPPFQTQTFASQLFWLALTFIGLYLLMAKVALPRIAAILENRRRHISDDLAAAENLKQQSSAALAAYEKALADARDRAHAIASETHHQLMIEAETRRHALEEKLNARLAEAETAIAATKSAAMANVRTIAVDAAAAIVEHLIGTAPTAKSIDKAVDEVLER
jgi:F-type H+-transporting ATPase subunit b